jgi:putative metallohydrolase (TIGR04338 family)
VSVRPRDSQRSKVYAAERFWRYSGGGRHVGARNERLETVPEMQAWVDKITASAWWQQRYPHVSKITVRDGAGQRRALGYPGRRMISMPKWSRSRGVILHEVAHVIAPTGTAWHGWEYCAELLALVQHFLGKEEADALRAAFDQERVRYRKPRQRRPLTEEQREVLVARLAVAREAKALKAASST